MSGFGNEFTSEDPRCPGALPEGQVWTFSILQLIPHAVCVCVCVCVCVASFCFKMEKNTTQEDYEQKIYSEIICDYSWS